MNSSLTSTYLRTGNNAQKPADTRRASSGGKFIWLDNQKFYICGVTYGPFRPNEQGSEYHELPQVERDFDLMCANGINAIRTYTVPPRWLLDAAQQRGLRVLIGLPWEQHITFLDTKARTRDILARIRASVRECIGHPAVLGYTVGNEIPAPIVRWYGPTRVERFIHELYYTAKEQDPAALVTYVNYPSTEYLELPFLDLVCFNVYLESRDKLEAYLPRLQNIAGERPLLLTEVGLDSRRNGMEQQARVLDWQVRTAFAAGCAGAFIFAWTDEWYRGGYDIEDWDFGITDRTRRPKPALAAVREAFSQVPFPVDPVQPEISVVVCSHNGARTIRECCEALLELEYPKYEVIIVNDGSRDSTAAIASEYGFRVISTDKVGLASARNIGMDAARGEIIAYLDDDARPDPHWLNYLAEMFLHTNHAAVGGPNIAVNGDGVIADCVANAPGNPVHVLLTDQEAEHIPGCNMAIRKSCLQAIGGFDPQFHVAGDDVDVCWRLQDKGWTLGFHPAAMVWHHRRSTVRGYFKQQVGYGKAEALLERKWLTKYNAAGHFPWGGRVYGKGHRETLSAQPRRIRYGTWGSALFQSIYQTSPGGWGWLPLLPEWYLVILALAALSSLGLLWTPLFLFVPLLVLAIGFILTQAALAASKATFTGSTYSSRISRKLRAIVFFLHLLQPMARLWGRRWLGSRSAPRQHPKTPLLPLSQGTTPRNLTVWDEHWQSANDRLQSLEAKLHANRAAVMRGGDYDRWDLEVRGGILGSARVLMVVEEHGAGKQLLRFRIWHTMTRAGIALPLLFLSLALWGFIAQAWISATLLSLVGLAFTLQTWKEGERAAGLLHRAIQGVKEEWRAF